MSRNFGSNVLVGLAGTVALFLTPHSATAGPWASAKSPANRDLVVRIHDDHDQGTYEERRRHRRYARRGHHIDAPFTHVETGRTVIVDAPFAHVYVGPRGRRIVAPFVDIWID